MAKKRLINCEFISASSFKVNVSNKGKLLYLMMFVSADDKGFVDTTNEIIQSLEKNDLDFTNTQNLSLLGNDYHCALTELLDKGLVYEFEDNHSNKIHLIRHWYFHNKMCKGLWTNYASFNDQVYVEANEYKLGKKPLKEDKLNETKSNHNTDMVGEVETETEQTEEEYDFPFELTDKEKKAMKEGD